MSGIKFRLIPLNILHVRPVNLLPIQRVLLRQMRDHDRMFTEQSSPLSPEHASPVKAIFQCWSVHQVFKRRQYHIPANSGFRTSQLTGSRDDISFMFFDNSYDMRPNAFVKIARQLFCLNFPALHLVFVPLQSTLPLTGRCFFLSCFPDRDSVNKITEFCI